MAGNHPNGVSHENMAINLLQTQLELPLIREEIANDLCDIRQGFNRYLDALNHELDDVHASQLDISNMVVDLKNRLSSLQVVYV